MDEQDQLSFTNYTTSIELLHNGYLPDEKLVEGLVLMLAGVLGILFNLLVLIMTCSCSHLRLMMNGFTVHGCFLEIFKSGLCIPYALTLLNIKLPDYCALLGTTYIIIQTAALFNLLAMVLAEAYTFHVHNLNERDTDREGALMCVLFGIVMIYAGSIIVHLGPTLIGGHFVFNEDIGNCLFAYGEIKNYIVQGMWIGITTLIYLILYRYIYKFYRLLKANEQFRITALARAAAQMSRGTTNNSESIYDIVYRLKKKVKVLLAMSLISMACWYPLFTLTLVDVNYKRPRYLYRILTVIAWSHSALMPLPLLLIDRSYGLWFQSKRLMKEYKESIAEVALSTEPTRRLLGNNSIESTPFNTPSMYPNKQRVVADYSPANNRKPVEHRVAVSSPPTQPKSTLPSYGSLTNNGVVKNHNTTNNHMLYDKLNAELHTIGTSLPSPMNNEDTVQMRVNQSRETDLIYDGSSLLDYDLI